MAPLKENGWRVYEVFILFSTTVCESIIISKQNILQIKIKFVKPYASLLLFLVREKLSPGGGSLGF